MSKKSKKEKKTTFPPEIVVTLDDENNGDDMPYLMASRSADDIAEVGVEKIVGVYTLQRVVKVKAESMIVETPLGDYADR